MVSSEVNRIAELDRQLRNIAYLKVKTEDLLKGYRYIRYLCEGAL